MNDSPESLDMHLEPSVPKPEGTPLTSTQVDAEELKTTRISEVATFILVLVKKLLKGDADGAISDVFDDSERSKKVAFISFVAFAETITMGILALLLFGFIISSLASNIIGTLSKMSMGLVQSQGFTFAVPLATGISSFIAGALFAGILFFVRAFVLGKTLDSIKVKLPAIKLLGIQALASIFNFIAYGISILVLLLSILMSLSTKTPLGISSITIGIVLLLIIISASFNLLLSYIFVDRVSVTGKNHLTPFLVFYVLVLSIVTILLFAITSSLIVI
ncbi:MAG: hypothetical protein LBI63_01390 [Candidatus Ancillula sp.]|jgi:hypothetical protein|nr:hypothetical protein [Candidatus Ancillula sp.]